LSIFSLQLEMRKVWIRVASKDALSLTRHWTPHVKKSHEKRNHEKKSQREDEFLKLFDRNKIEIREDITIKQRIEILKTNPRLLALLFMMSL
jgi:hypothetical protein